MFLLPQDFYEERTTSHKGRGIFALQDIPGGTVIGDYLGTIIKTTDLPTDEPIYDMYFNDTDSVVADPKEMGIHLINHSCMPNCDAFPYEGHILYFALRKIFKGEELSVHYAIGPISDDEGKCTHICTCGTPLCTGSFHCTQELVDKWEVLLEKNGYHNEPHDSLYGKKIQPLKSYPKSIEDNIFYNLFASQEETPVEVQDSVLTSVEQIRNTIRTTGRACYTKSSPFAIYGYFGNYLLSKPKQ